MNKMSSNIELKKWNIFIKVKFTFKPKKNEQNTYLLEFLKSLI